LLLPYLFIAFVAVVLLAGLGRLPLFGRDEALYAEAAREMHSSGDWITPRVNGAFFFEKPPLLYWLDALAYSALGPTPLAARLPAALLGILTIALTVTTASRVWGKRAGVLAGVTLATCPLVVMVARMGIMDMPLTCLVTLSMLAYARWRRQGGLAPALAFGLLVGLAVLLKGLAGGLAPAVAVIHAISFRQRPQRISVASAFLAFLGMCLVAAPWFVAMGLRHGEGYAAIFFIREHLLRIARPMQGHGGSALYYLLLIAFAFFPWVAFLPAALAPRRDHDNEATFWRSLALVWFLVVLVPFSLIKTKLPGYIMPLFPPMAMLVAAELDRRLEKPGRAPWIGAVAGGVILAGVFSLLPLVAARLGARYNAANAAFLLVVPAAFWLGGYVASVIGGIEGMRGRPRAALTFMVAGQLAVVGSLLIGMLPVLSPYLGGGPAYLAQLAKRELPGRRIVLYETRPETVAFVLRRAVPVFSHNEKAQLMTALRREPTALIAPLEEQDLWGSLPHDQLWRRGLDVLVDVQPLSEKP
jgi:4-amino-4-deoxy-L-arabinose transferase-like glycosyltransferase